MSIKLTFGIVAPPARCVSVRRVIFLSITFFSISSEGVAVPNTNGMLACLARMKHKSLAE